MARNRDTPLSVSEFKATCLEVLERVRRTRRSVVITKRGTPIAEVIPPSTATLGRDWLGAMRGTARIKADIVAPVGPAGDWEALRK